MEMIHLKYKLSFWAFVFLVDTSAGVKEGFSFCL